jgi:hypothetical protein
VDTVYYDLSLKGYPNPITLSTTVTNPTTVATDTIRASVILPRDFKLAAGETREKIIPTIAPGGQQGLQWLLDAIADTSTAPRTAVVRLQYFTGGQLVTCERSIVIMPFVLDSAVMELACASPDRIRFINAETGLSPSPFTFTVEMRNTGSLDLHNLSATLRLPTGVDLESGESLTKQVTATLAPGLRMAASWTIVPREAFSPLVANFLVFVNCTELPEQRCQTTTIVDPIRRLVIFSLPVGTVGRTSQSVPIPLSVANPDRVPLRSFNIVITYDPALVEPTGVTTDGTLTSGWPLADMQVPTPGTLVLRGGSSAPSIQDGVLMYITFRVVSGDGTNAPFGVKHSDLIFGDVAVTDTADVVTTNGDIWTTGDCLTGLDATGSYQLFQNIPNPFNPETTIRYFIPGTTPQYITLELFDIYGRRIQALESGYRAAGMQQTMFKADGLPGGTYFYVLRAGSASLLKRMVLLK